MIFEKFACHSNPFSENIPSSAIHRNHYFSLILEQLELFPELGDIALLSARTGLGKTTLLTALMETWRSPYDVTYLHLGSLKGAGLMRAILHQLGEHPRMGKDRMFAQVFAQLSKRNRPLCLIIDEAQLMEVASMTDLRLLCSNPEMSGRLKLLLSGQPILEKTIQAEPLTDLRERLCLKVHLKPMSMTESIDYIAHRLNSVGGNMNIFEEDALQLIANATKGVPRKINGLCFRSMLSAINKEEKVIDANIVREVHASELP